MVQSIGKCRRPPAQTKSSGMIPFQSKSICAGTASPRSAIFFHPDCTVGFGVSPNHALRLVGCTTGRESHPALKILDSISGSIIAWYIIECKPFLKPGQNRDGTTFRRRTLSRGLAPSSSLSFCQSFHRVFLQAAESGVFSKASLPHGRQNRLTSPAKKNRAFPTAGYP